MDKLAWFFRIVWACRISLISGAAGIALFCVATPAQNLLDDLSFSTTLAGAILFWLMVFLLTIVMWALPVHYGARATLDDDGWIVSRVQARAMSDVALDTFVAKVRETNRRTIQWMPRVLGLLPFIALGFGLYFSTQTDMGATGLDEGDRTARQTFWLPIADMLAAAVYTAFVVARRPLAQSLRATRVADFVDRLPLIALVLTTGFFVTAYFAPLLVVGLFPRALLIAPLFGSLVLLLSVIQRATHRQGLPFFLVIVIGALAVTAWNRSFHDLRTVSREGGDGRLTIAEAIGKWKAANGCDPQAIACGRRPLVVAIDGGASRAAFTAATFIGGLLDRMKVIDSEAETPARRIFAISGVSGGAFGAAIIQASVRDAQERGSPAAAPCRTATPEWFGYIYAKDHEPHRQYRWQECLQVLASGDFLSPTIVGLAFRDFFAPPHVIQDRAVLLEQSWERHYHAIVADDGKDGVCTDFARDGLCRPIGYPTRFQTTSPKERPKSWVPLLVLNGTSVRTGRRIVASDLKASQDVIGPRPLFSQAFDLSEAMSSPCPDAIDRQYPGQHTAYDINLNATLHKQSVRTNEQGVCAKAPMLDGPDVRLSTAALIGARFPLISPAGTFAMPPPKDESSMNNKENLGDRVVDGGYFENSGLTSAIEIVEALKGGGLDPLLVSIANEPTESDSRAAERKESDPSPAAGGKGRAPLYAPDAVVPRRPSTTPLAADPGNGFFSRMFELVEAPLEGLYATRAGHAFESEDRAESMASRQSANGRPVAPVLAAFHRFHVAAKPNLRELKADDPGGASDDYDKAYCEAIWDRQQHQALVMAKVSMSWWLSALVQADLDAQKCDANNQRAMHALMRDLVGQ